MPASFRSIPGLVIDVAMRPPPSGTLPPVAAAARTPGTLRDLIDDPRDLRPDIARRGPALDTRRKLRRQHVLRGEAGVDAQHRHEAADEERRADDQHDRQRELDDHEEVAQSPCRAPVLPRPPLLSAVVRSTPELCSAGTIPKATPVASDISAAAASTRRFSAIAVDTWYLVGEAALRIWMPQAGGDHGERGASTGQHEAFDQQLPHQPPASRAERRAEADLALTRAGAREQQIGDVGARDEQDDADGAKQHQHPRRMSSPTT